MRARSGRGQSVVDTGVISQDDHEVHQSEGNQQAGSSNVPVHPVPGVARNSGGGTGVAADMDGCLEMAMALVMRSAMAAADTNRKILHMLTPPLYVQ